MAKASQPGGIIADPAAYITDAHTRRQKASQQLFRAGGFYYPKATLQTPYFGSVFIEVIDFTIILYHGSFPPVHCPS